jgi:hypothetical protein
MIEAMGKCVTLYVQPVTPHSEALTCSCCTHQFSCHFAQVCWRRLEGRRARHRPGRAGHEAELGSREENSHGKRNEGMSPLPPPLLAPPNPRSGLCMNCRILVIMSPALFRSLQSPFGAHLAEGE